MNTTISSIQAYLQNSNPGDLSITEIGLISMAQTEAVLDVRHSRNAVASSSLANLYSLVPTITDLPTFLALDIGFPDKKMCFPSHMGCDRDFVMRGDMTGNATLFCSKKPGYPGHFRAGSCA